MVHRRRARGLARSRCRTRDLAGHPLHRLDADLPAPVADASAENIARYRGYPRLVGETGGKDFVIAHPSADVDVLRTALVRGAFEYQGQKCSAASRAYVPALGVAAARRTTSSTTSSRCRWATSPTSATSWAPSSTSARSPSTSRRSSGPRSAATRGHRRRQLDDRDGWFVRPTVVLGERPDRRDVQHRVLRPDPGGPRLRRRAATTRCVDAARVGVAVRADRRDHRPGPDRDRRARRSGCASRPATSTSTTSRPAPSSGSSRSAAARASGTNDKAGLGAEPACAGRRTRSIKETFVPPTIARLPAHGLILALIMQTG